MRLSCPCGQGGVGLAFCGCSLRFGFGDGLVARDKSTGRGRKRSREGQEEVKGSPWVFLLVEVFGRFDLEKVEHISAKMKTCFNIIYIYIYIIHLFFCVFFYDLCLRIGVTK